MDSASLACQISCRDLMPSTNSRYAAPLEPVGISARTVVTHQISVQLLDQSLGIMRSFLHVSLAMRRKDRVVADKG